MCAFITNAELTFLWAMLAIPTAVAYIRLQARRKKGEASRNGCLPWAIGATCLGAIIILLNFGETWWRTRPQKMMVRFLEIQDLSSFSDVRSDFVGGLDYTAWIYFQTSKERLLRLVKDLDFTVRPPGDWNQAYFAGFPKAPELPSEQEAVVYFRVSPKTHDLQYIVTESTHQRVWFVSLNY